MSKKTQLATPTATEVAVHSVSDSDVSSHLSKAANRATQESDTLTQTADRVESQMQAIDEKVNAAYKARATDPETAGDKILQMATPALSGIVAGKIFQIIWNTVINRIHPSKDDDEQDRQQGIIMSMIFAALSAAFTTLITSWSTRGSNALIRHLQHRREEKK